MVKSLVLRAARLVEFHQCWWICFQVCGSKRLGCHTDYTVSRCRTRGKSEESIVGKPGIHPGFETRSRCDQKYKTGVPVAPKRTCVSQKLKKKPKTVGQYTYMASYGVIGVLVVKKSKLLRISFGAEVLPIYHGRYIIILHGDCHLCRF